MTHNPVTIGPRDSLRKARLLMQQGHFRHLPVLEEDRIVGMVTDRDIRDRSPSRSGAGEQSTAEELMDHLRVMGIMTLQPVTIPPSMPILEAARLLRARHVGALLVAADGELLGIVTKSDIIDALIAEHDTAAEA